MSDESVVERLDWRLLGAEDPANPHLFTLGSDDSGRWVYPFLDNDLNTDDPEGLMILDAIAEIRRLEKEVSKHHRLQTLAEDRATRLAVEVQSLQDLVQQLRKQLARTENELIELLNGESV